MSKLAIAPGWFDITESLPSKGRFYSGQVHVRPYNFEEVSSVSERLSLEVQDEASAYRHILSGMSMSDGSDVSQMFIGDFLYAAFHRKVISVGTREFIVGNLLDGWTSDPISASDIDFTDLDVPALPVKTMILDEWVEFHPVTTEQWLTFLVEHKRHAKVSDFIVMMSDGKVDPRLVLELDEIDTLTQVITALQHGMKPIELKMTNKGGGETKTMTINLDSQQTTIVLPFRRPGEVRKTKLFFGTESPNAA